MTMLISLLFLMVFFIILLMAKKKNFEQECNTMFECGFNSAYKCHIKFPMNSLNFMFMFLFLDMEILLFVPFVKEWKTYFLNSSFFLLLFCILMAMMMEWKKSFLKWSF